MQHLFPANYRSGRDRFCTTAAKAGWQVESHLLTARGPGGEALTIDVASTTPEAETTLLLTGGIHGVEGFFSSGVLQAVLARWPELRPAARRVRLVMVYALNPFGFAWVRRTNEDNVDPNRNFLRPGEAYQGCPPAYRKLHNWLNPQAPPARWESFRVRAGLALLRHGMPALKQIVAGGQYEFPRGLFYGGAEPTQTMKILQENLPQWLHGSRRVLHFDFHTGLGRWATYKLLLDQDAPRRRQWLERHFGRDSVSSCDPHGVAYQAQGDIGRWCASRFPQIDYTYLCAEFGTYAPLSVIGGLRLENQTHHWCPPDAPVTLAAKRRLQELFCPQSPDWRKRVVEHGLTLVQQGMQALVEPA